MTATSATAVAASLSVAGPGLRMPLGVGAASLRAPSSPRPARTMAVVQASAQQSAREKPAAGLAVAAVLVLPEVTEAAQPGLWPSLKNFLLSIVSSGVALVAIGGAVSIFDPVMQV